MSEPVWLNADGSTSPITTATASADAPDWHAVALRELAAVAHWKAVATGRRYEVDAWRDALRLTTAEREWLDNCLTSDEVSAATASVVGQRLGGDR